MFAAKELIKQELNEEYSPAGAEIYSLKFSEKDFGKKSISLSNKKNLSEEDQKILNEAIIVVCVEAINNYVDRVSSGKFNLSSLKNRESVVCEYCDFKGICRIKEVS